MQKKERFFAMSVAMGKDDAIAFKESLGPEDKYFLLKVSENPKARNLDRREQFVIVRRPHKGEWVPSAYRVFANTNKLGKSMEGFPKALW